MSVRILVLLLILLLPVNAMALTTYYVDPTFSGGSNDGSASNPWTSPNWTTISSTLASDDVTVYFTARAAGSDTHESSNRIIIDRNGNQANDLVLDGMTMWNQNDSSGSWTTYPGSVKFNVGDGGYMFYIGHSAQGDADNLTIRGFTSLPGGMRQNYIGGGDNITLEYLTLNPGQIYMEYANYASSHGTYGPHTNRTFRYNYVYNTIGECMYLGGAGDSGLAGHSNISAYGNTVTGCGDSGGQGDGIDVKDGNTGVLIYDNYIYDTDDRGITSLSPFIAYNNIIDSVGVTGNAACIYLDSFWGTAGDFTEKILIYNNVCFRPSSEGIKIAEAGASIASTVYIFNNSISRVNEAEGAYNQAIQIQGPDTQYVVNNSVYGRTGNTISLGGYTSLTNDYNIFHNVSLSGLSLGANSSSADPGFASTTDLTIDSGDIGYDAGSDQSAFFSTDILGISRPQSTAWDIGAYEYESSTTHNLGTFSGSGSIQ